MSLSLHCASSRGIRLAAKARHDFELGQLMRNTCNYMWLRNTTLCPAPLIAIGIANAIVTLWELCCLRLHLHLCLRLWLLVSLVESMPGDNPRNLINTQVHGSKLSRQSPCLPAPFSSWNHLLALWHQLELWLCLSCLACLRLWKPHKYLVYLLAWAWD